MEEIIKFDESYKKWISEVGNRFKKSQIKAAVKVNDEMLHFYWNLGKDMTTLRKNSKWGNHFFQKVSNDLVAMLPEVKSFSPRNLLYMCQFYKMYPEAEITHQVGAENKSDKITHQLGAQFQLDSIFMIPWGHHKLILDKCKEQEKALFFVNKTIENNWSRAMLLNFLDTNLYERQGKAISNFKKVLPDVQSDLAQEMTKDPYNFDFLTLREGYDEKELKDALMENVQIFLMELGMGFAFLGREYRLEVGKTEQFIDMLFYNVVNHCYVVVEIKTRDFQPGDMGQLGTYVSAVDGILRKENDNQTVGLLICKTKDNVLAKYAVNAVNVPIGISEYDMNNLIPENYRSSMPTIEEIESNLKD
jgi:predicted nuclease of restriction endonuclease-like (RecB) superfamily